MFNKLKEKLLRMNLVIISVLMLFSFIALYFITYATSQNALEDHMTMVAEIYQVTVGEDFTMSPRPIESKKNLKDINPLASFVIQVDENHTILSEYAYFDIDDNLLINAYKIIEEQGTSRNKFMYNKNQWSFIITDNKAGHLYVFLNTTSQNKLLTKMTLAFAGLYVIIFAIILLVSKYLTNQSMKPIQDAFDRQKQFIYDASHELKTPLTIINTNIDVILDDKYIKDSENWKWLKYIKIEVGRMKKLTKDLLYLAQVDGEKEEDSIFNSFDFSNLLNHHILGIEGLSIEKNIRLLSDIKPNITAYGNKEQLSQVVIILLDNALKYTKVKGTINVTLKKISNTVMLTIKNDCEGLTKEQQGKIFDRFYRTDKARNRAEGNHGLGLSIAKSIIDGHDGKIICSSKMNESVTFEIKLKST
jgi:signal transduction histidine kinase